MGANLEKKIKNILSSLLFSLTKIAPLRRYFYSNNFKGELCSTLSNIVKGNSFNNRINDYINKSKEKIKNEDKDKINSKLIINYLIEEINKELENEGKNDTILKDLFYGSYELISNEGIKELKYTKKPLIISIDLSKLNLKRYKIEKKDEGKMIDVDGILKNELKKIISQDNPEFLQKDIKNVQMPEICIMTFLEINSNILSYYVSQKIKGIPYELIYFLEEKGDEDKKKSYFKENYFWYQYQSNDESIKDIKDIEKIKGNPQIVFYQKNNWLIKNLMKNKLIIFSEKQRILELMNEHIIPEHKYDNYYLVNKYYLYEFKKILEDRESIEENIYEKALPLINEKNLLEITDQKDILTNFKYPVNFVLIQEKAFKQFVDNSNINPEAKPKENESKEDKSKKDKSELDKLRRDLKEKIYQVKLGENHIFIKMEKDNDFFQRKNEKEKIFVCRYDEKNEMFEVEIVLNYFKKGGFDLDLEKYISNRGGMEYFYRLKKINVKRRGLQDINENGEKIGEIAIIRDVNSHMNITKYEMLEPLQV